MKKEIAENMKLSWVTWHKEAIEERDIEIRKLKGKVKLLEKEKKYLEQAMESIKNYGQDNE